MCFILRFSLRVKLAMSCFCSQFGVSCGPDAFSETSISIMLRLDPRKGSLKKVE